MSVKTRVLDSWAVLEWMRGERSGAGRTVAALLDEAEAGKTQLLMSAINAGEAYYILRKSHRDALSDLWRESSASMPVRFDVPSADDIWSAALLKAQFPIAYADAFAAALAIKHACPLVTGDPELRTVEKLQLDWIGA